MMFTTYWEMQFNPFAKAAALKNHFQSEDFKQASARFKHLLDIKGIGLFTGLAGVGKTLTLKIVADALNPSMFKVFYLPLSTITNLEFFRAIALGLGIVPPQKKIDLFNAIQERIISLSKDKRITTVIMVDEGQYLNSKILNDLKILLNFHMDSENHAVFVIAGQPILTHTLSMHSHEALAQRIVISYSFNGLAKDEVQEYLRSRLEAAGVKNSIFADNAIEAIWAASGASPRLINSIAEKCLIIGAQKNATIIDTDIVMLANNEISLI